MVGSRWGRVLEGVGLPASAGWQTKRAKCDESNRRVTAGQAKREGGRVFVRRCGVDGGVDGGELVGGGSVFSSCGWALTS